MNKRNRSPGNPVRVSGKTIRYGNDLTPLISDFLHCCEETRKHCDQNLKAWKTKERAYKRDPTKAHPGPKPKTYPIIQNTTDLERIVELERWSGEAPRDDSRDRQKLQEMIRIDPQIGELIAETWRRKHAAELRLREEAGAGANENTE